MPAPQERQTAAVVAATVVEYVPALHCVHVLASVAPTAALHVPALQLVQEVPPGATAYVPAAQGVQVATDVPVDGPMDPAGHSVQAAEPLAPLAPAVEKVPTGQRPEQAAVVCPTTAGSNHVPGGHARHALAEVPLAPPLSE